MIWACEPFEPFDPDAVPVVCDNCHLQHGWCVPEIEQEHSLCRKCLEQIVEECKEATIQ